MRLVDGHIRVLRQFLHNLQSMIQVRGRGEGIVDVPNVLTINHSGTSTPAGEHGACLEAFATPTPTMSLQILVLLHLEMLRG